MNEVAQFATSMGLTEQQDIYCREWVVCMSIKESAAAAGLSYDYARHLHHVDHIASHIQLLMDERRRRLNLNADYVLLRLHEIESLDMADVYEADGSLKNIHDMSPQARRCIKGVDSSYTRYGNDENKVETVTKRVTLESRINALRDMGKHVSVKAFEREGPPPANQVFILNMTGIKDGEDSPYIDADYTEESEHGEQEESSA